MTLRTRLKKIEAEAAPGLAERPSCIFLCALTDDAEAASDPRVALLMRGKLGEEVSRLPGESAETFVDRVEKLLKSTSINGEIQ